MLVPFICRITYILALAIHLYVCWRLWPMDGSGNGKSWLRIHDRLALNFVKRKSLLIA